MHAIGRIPRLITLLVVTLVAILAVAASAFAKPAVTDARLGVEPNLTRVVLNLTEQRDFRIFTLADPYRVVIDLDEVDWKIAGGTKLQGRGLVAAMRYGLFKTGTSRVVLDLIEPSEVAQATLLPADGNEPPRLLVDLRPVADGQFRAQLKTAIFASKANPLAGGNPAPETLAAAPVAVATATPQAGSKPVTPNQPLNASQTLSSSAAPKLQPRLAPRDPDITTAAGGATGAPGLTASAAKQPEQEAKRGKRRSSW